MNAPCLGQFCCQVLAFFFVVVTFNIDAKLFCLYVSGGFHLLAHRKGGGGGWQNYLESPSNISQPPTIVMATIT